MINNKKVKNSELDKFHNGRFMLQGIDGYKDVEKNAKLEECDLLKKLNVLYLDDDEDILVSYECIHRFDFNIFTTSSAKKAKEIIETNDIHIIIGDQRMPDITGLEFFASIIDKHPEPIRILLTGCSDIETIISYSNFNLIYGCLYKPFTPEEMKLVIKNAAEVYFLRKEKKRLLNRIATTMNEIEFIYNNKKSV